MSLEIRLSWDATGRWAAWLDEVRRELIVAHDDQSQVYLKLCTEAPDELGWVRVEHSSRRQISVGDAVGYCFADLDAECAMLEITRRAVRAARARGKGWHAGARRLENQVRNVGGQRRVPLLPFKAWWEYASDPQVVGTRVLTLSEAAKRAGYRMKDGRADTSRLQRRLGLRAEATGGRRAVSERVNYETAVRLCRALELDPVDLGL